MPRLGGEASEIVAGLRQKQEAGERLEPEVEEALETQPEVEQEAALAAQARQPKLIRQHN